MAAVLTDAPEGAPAQTAATPAHLAKPWRSRLLVVVGIILLALNLRGAVTSVSPVLADLRAELGLTTTGAGLLGMAPPFAFAVSAALTPAVIRRLGPERTAWVALAIAAAGQLLRSWAVEPVAFLVLSMAALLGMGMGNVVLPPLVKKYFPHRIGAATSAYALLLTVGTALPALFAVPVADLAGWRVSIGQWSLIAAAAAVPWVVLAARSRSSGAQSTGTRSTDGPSTDAQSTDGPSTDTPAAAGAGRGRSTHIPASAVLRSPVAWGLAAMIGTTSLNTYAMFAWLPELLLDAGLDDHLAGSMLSLYAAMGMPVAVLVPWAAARLRNPLPVVLGALLLYAVAYAGLALSPASRPVLWVVAAGLAPVAFPLSLALVNLRSRTHAGSAALSGFSQSVGYLLAGAGPLVVGALHDATGGWHGPILFLTATLLVQVAGAVVVCRPRMLEDDVPSAALQDDVPSRAVAGRH